MDGTPPERPKPTLYIVKNEGGETSPPEHLPKSFPRMFPKVKLQLVKGHESDVLENEEVGATVSQDDKEEIQRVERENIARMRGQLSTIASSHVQRFTEAVGEPSEVSWFDRAFRGNPESKFGVETELDLIKGDRRLQTNVSITSHTGVKNEGSLRIPIVDGFQRIKSQMIGIHSPHYRDWEQTRQLVDLEIFFHSRSTDIDTLLVNFPTGIPSHLPFSSESVLGNLFTFLRTEQVSSFTTGQSNITKLLRQPHMRYPQFNFRYYPLDPYLPLRLSIDDRTSHFDKNAGPLSIKNMAAKYDKYNDTVSFYESGAGEMYQGEPVYSLSTPEYTTLFDEVLSLVPNRDGFPNLQKKS